MLSMSPLRPEASGVPSSVPTCNQQGRSGQLHRAESEFAGSLAFPGTAASRPCVGAAYRGITPKRQRRRTDAATTARAPRSEAHLSSIRLASDEHHLYVKDRPSVVPSGGACSRTNDESLGFGGALPRPPHVPPSRFLTVLTAFATTGPQACCSLHPTLGFTGFQPLATACPQRCSASSPVLHPSELHALRSGRLSPSCPLAVRRPMGTTRPRGLDPRERPSRTSPFADDGHSAALLGFPIWSALLPVLRREPSGERDSCRARPEAEPVVRRPAPPHAPASPRARCSTHGSPRRPDENASRSAQSPPLSPLLAWLARRSAPPRPVASDR
jgi:hypothetical protein